MKKFKDYCDELMTFFAENGVVLDPPPAVKLDHRALNRFDPFVPTGHYDYTTNTITLYVSNRQCKDILRTFCHEMIHVKQYQKDPEGYASFDKSGNLSDNAVLRKYEKEAYEKGNLLFRDWTERNPE